MNRFKSTFLVAVALGLFTYGCQTVAPTPAPEEPKKSTQPVKGNEVEPDPSPTPGPVNALSPEEQIIADMNMACVCKAKGIYPGAVCSGGKVDNACNCSGKWGNHGDIRQVPDGICQGQKVNPAFSLSECRKGAVIPLEGGVSTNLNVCQVEFPRSACPAACKRVAGGAFGTAIATACRGVCDGCVEDGKPCSSVPGNMNVAATLDPSLGEKIDCGTSGMVKGKAYIPGISDSPCCYEDGRTIAKMPATNMGSNFVGEGTAAQKCCSGVSHITQLGNNKQGQSLGFTVECGK